MNRWMDTPRTLLQNIPEILIHKYTQQQEREEEEEEASEQQQQ